MEYKKIWIIGGGRFGRLALERLAQSCSGAEITLVDRAPVKGLSCEHAETVCDDGVAWLGRMLHRRAAPDILVPALPVHLAAEWLRLRLRSRYKVEAVEIPDKQLRGFPNPVRGKKGRVFLSHADFLCPDDCPEPRHICTHTQQPRPRSLFRLLEEMKIPGVLPLVLRSRQILPGVGGLLPHDLFGAHDRMRLSTGQTFMAGVACRCHGVVDFLRCSPRGGRPHSAPSLIRSA